MAELEQSHNQVHSALGYTYSNFFILQSIQTILHMIIWKWKNKIAEKKKYSQLHERIGRIIPQRKIIEFIIIIYPDKLHPNSMVLDQ